MPTFRSKRSDTKISKIEETYGIDLNARGDMRLGNLLKRRGFNSQSQLLDAYRGKLSSHSKKRKTFLSFHAEDIRQVQGFRLMCMSEHVDVDIYDGSVREAIDSKNSSYVKQVIRDKIRKVAVLVCLIGNGTAWRDWVEWEIQTAYEFGKGVCGVRLKGSHGRTPPPLVANGAPVARWNLQEIIAVIECAAARRS